MSAKRLFVSLSTILLMLCATTAFVAAQTSTSAFISGTVTDPTGASVPGATVLLTQTGTGETAKVVSDGVGHYVFPAVKPADYSLNFSATGFQTSIVQQFHVEVQRSYTLDMPLKVGRANETIEVTDVATAELQTTNATVGT